MRLGSRIGFRTASPPVTFTQAFKPFFSSSRIVNLEDGGRGGAVRQRTSISIRKFAQSPLTLRLDQLGRSSLARIGIVTPDRERGPRIGAQIWS